MIFCLIKIFKEEDECHANSFLENGEMYCQTLNAFKAMQDGNVRGDEQEGVTFWVQPEDATVILSIKKDSSSITHTIPSSDLAGPITFQTTAFDHLNLFCMYAISINDFEKHYASEEERKVAVAEINKELKEQIRIEPETLKLGSHAIIIYKVNEFVRKIEDYAKSLNIKLYHNPIRYFDEDSYNGVFKGITAIFHKTQSYSFQQEFRFAFDINKDGDNKTIKIGSLKDLAFKTKLEDIESHLTISLQE